MKRMNLRDVPEDVFAALAAAAAANHQSLNAFVVDVLVDTARVISIADYVHGYRSPVGTGITLDDAVAAVRAVRESS
jgi:hypothetical protein